MKARILKDFALKDTHVIILGCRTAGNRDKQERDVYVTYVSQHPMFDLHWPAPAGFYNAARNCRPF